MRVFVAGATGVAGRRTVGLLAATGYEVTGVARNPQKAQLLERLGAAPIDVDLFDAAAVRDSLHGHRAVINLATKIPPPSRALLPGAWSENNRIRSEVSRNLVDAALAAGAECYVQESLAFVYPDSGDDWIDEDAAVEVPSYARSMLEAERHANRFTSGGGAGVVLRFGQFYASDSAHTLSMVGIARRGISPFVGPRDAFAPFVHADDVASAVGAALEAPAGTYNIADDDPLTRGELANVLAAAVGAERLRFVPVALSRLGGAKVRVLMRSQRVSNRRFRSATGWAPSFRSTRRGIPIVVEAIARRKDE